MRGKRILVPAAFVVLTLGACGGGDKASTTIDATAVEFKLSPDSWTVPAGEELTIRLTNKGAIDHEWVVIKLGEDLASEADFAEDKVLFEVEAEPGKSTTGTFTIDEPGDYQIICGIPDHFNAGMKGTLTVE